MVQFDLNAAAAAHHIKPPVQPGRKQQGAQGMSAQHTAEYNAAVAELHITAMKVLKRLLESETDPKELRRLTAIAFRARAAADPDTPRRAKPRSANHDRHDEPDEADTPASTDTTAAPPLWPACDEHRIEPLTPTGHPFAHTSPTPSALLNSAGSARRPPTSAPPSVPSL